MSRADWHFADLVVDESDPFADTDVREQGVKVDLTSPRALKRKLTELLAHEGLLHGRGVTCALKDRADSCCSACPLRGTAKTHPIRELCNTGVAQEQTVMAALAADE